MQQKLKSLEAGICLFQVFCKMCKLYTQFKVKAQDLHSEQDF